MANFKDWTQTKLKETFGLVNKNGECDELKEWMKAGNDTNLLINDREQTELERIRKRLSINADIWNEEELKMYFISFLLDIVSFESEKYKLFFERKLSATLNGIKLSGDVDAMIAGGNFDDPRVPYFCLHEYKQEKGKREADPRGQLLSEMLAAQTLNQDKTIPIYGSYMLGRLWFFGTLINYDFCFSGGFVADGDDIYRIFRILRQLKCYIDARVA